MDNFQHLVVFLVLRYISDNVFIEVREVANRWTDRQTDRQTDKHNLLRGGSNTEVNDVPLSYSCGVARGVFADPIH